MDTRCDSVWNTPWSYHGKCRVPWYFIQNPIESPWNPMECPWKISHIFPWTFMEYKTWTAILQDRPAYGRRRQGHYMLLLIFYFVSIDERPAMGSQPNLTSRSEVVSIYKCPQQFWGAKNINFDHFFATSAVDIPYLRNETSRRQTKMTVSIYNVSPKSWPTFRDLWPRNGWDPFAHYDPPFGGHCVATIIVATCFCKLFLPFAYRY